MIRVKNNKDVISVIAKGKPITYIYKGTLLLWQSVRSCFGSGVWNSDKPWVNDEQWKDTKNIL